MKRLLARITVDRTVLLLLGTVLMASILPPRGTFRSVAEAVADGGIITLFFLHGARLGREAILEGARNWRLHLAVGAMTFVVFPLLGLAVHALPGLAPPIATGMLFLTLLPSTVQSSIAFTALAGGNVAAAVCSASFSNLAGIVLTPLLVALLMTGATGGFSLDAVETIMVQLLLPFLAGHLLRPWIGAWVVRQKKLLGVVDRGSILLVVYTAFGAAVVGGLWQRLAPADLLLIAALSGGILAAVLGLSHALGRWLGLSRADRIVLQFCGSKKSLASGVPMAGVLFPPAQVGAVILPLIFFHQIQLMICAMLAQRWRAGETDSKVASHRSGTPDG
ncbi:bile acid:sodium symporter [Novosphingobium sp. KCTC 2891]|uniref:bile acid:sodium symporter family protein n=1 Tax=Novosphingobium sp. KCTC 2891 TaxID=2989730 RepID=UPI0022214A8C|nr:bile acid:sodium symporter family protein [Novosphingobium sp. KCTC 2891]MCW1383748.1 bile acid:sodium symporter [Novosphingobium sp. KCTC 2891]